MILAVEDDAKFILSDPVRDQDINLSRSFTIERWEINIMFDSRVRGELALDTGNQLFKCDAIVQVLPRPV